LSGQESGSLGVLVAVGTPAGMPACVF